MPNRLGLVSRGQAIQLASPPMSDQPASLSAGQSALLTLVEAAAQTGRSVNALRKLIARGKIRAVRGNDGLVRVHLSASQLASLQAIGTAIPVTSQEDQSSTIKALEASLVDMRERLTRAEQELATERQAYRALAERLASQLADRRRPWWRRWRRPAPLSDTGLC